MINLSGGGEFKFSKPLHGGVSARRSAENFILNPQQEDGSVRKILFKSKPISLSDLKGFTDLEIAALSRLAGRSINTSEGHDVQISDTAKNILNNNDFDVSRVLSNVEETKKAIIKETNNDPQATFSVRSSGSTILSPGPNGRTVAPPETRQARASTLELSREKPAAFTPVEVVGANSITGGPDHRARLRPKRSEINQVYGDTNSPNNNILAPLFPTNGGSDGLIWPYTPNITYAPVIDYQNHPLAFTNQDYYSFSKVPSAAIQVIGQFTAQSPKEAKYALACIHFLRVVTKMHFGEVETSRIHEVTQAERIAQFNSGANIGTTLDSARSSLAEPPPKLLFSAYGKFGFKDIPVYVQNFSIDFSDQINHVPIEYPIYFGENSIKSTASTRTTWVPANFVITVSLQPQIHSSRWNHPDISGETQYNWDKFASGELFEKSNGGWI